MTRGFVSLALCGLSLLMTGCWAVPEQAAAGGQAVPITETVRDPGDIKYYPSDEPLRMGIEQFGRGNYGLSERYFRDAVEKAPKDATAWIGLAASYDRIRRFDLADRAYIQAIKLVGETVQLLNNQGYSYMLRGDLQRARQKFHKAYELNPSHPVILNNLELLNGSRRFIDRNRLRRRKRHLRGRSCRPRGRLPWSAGHPLGCLRPGELLYASWLSLLRQLDLCEPEITDASHAARE
jgi:tetratricopeptide (TPR) repeat protein